MALTKVSTDGVKDDAITKTKIPANQIEASELADNAVDTNAIADQAVALSKLPHGTSSNDGKFLRANNGADPTFETVNTDLVSDTSPQLGGDLQSNGNNILIADTSGTGNNRLKFGDSGDLAIYHDGTNSYLAHESGTGDLILNTDSTCSINPNGGGHFGLRVISNGCVELYQAGNKKFETESNGSTVTGRFRVQNSGDTDLVISDTSANAVSGFLGVKTAGKLEYNCYKSGVGTKYPHVFVGYTEEYARIDTNGIKFNGDTAAANALDDYEEGTWTPTITGGAITANGAYYTKVGRVVHWYLYGTITNTANNSTEFRIYGLPFTVGGNTQGLNNYYGGAASINYTQSANNGGLTNMGVLAHGSTNYLYFHFIGVGDSNQPTNSYFHSHMLNQGFIIAGSYFV